MSKKIKSVWEECLDLMSKGEVSLEELNTFLVGTLLFSQQDIISSSSSPLQERDLLLLRKERLKRLSGKLKQRRQRQQKLYV